MIPTNQYPFFSSLYRIFVPTLLLNPTFLLFSATSCENNKATQANQPALPFASPFYLLNFFLSPFFLRFFFFPDAGFDWYILVLCLSLLCTEHSG